MSKVIPVSELIIEAIKVAIKTDSAVLHEPSLNGNEWLYLRDCLDSTFVSSVGPYVDRFESDLQNYTGARHAIAVVNGTAALHVALLLAGVKQGDEVLIPALTFIATANAVSYCGAIPHFIDSESVSLGIDAMALRDYLETKTEIHNKQCINRVTGQVIRAVVPVHTFGHPVKIDELLAVAHDHHLTIVEDAAESLGSTIEGKHAGTFGLISALSFNGNKTITTGGGGAILTNDSALARRAKHITTTAKTPHSWEYIHDEVGFNYRMPNINAALGCAQIEQLPDILVAKRALFLSYQSAFTDLSNMAVFCERKNTVSNYWLQTLLLDDSIADYRDKILEDTNNANLMTRPAWRLLSGLKPYQSCQKMELSIARSLEKRIINLPSSVCLA